MEDAPMYATLTLLGVTAICGAVSVVLMFIRWLKHGYFSPHDSRVRRIEDATGSFTLAMIAAGIAVALWGFWSVPAALVSLLLMAQAVRAAFRRLPAVDAYNGDQI